MAVPEDAPPAPETYFMAPPSSRSSLGNHVASLFDQVMDDMQALQQRLRDAHLVELANCQASAAFEATVAKATSTTRRTTSTGPVLPSAVASAPESPSAPSASSPPQGLRGSLKTGQSEPSLSVPKNPRLSKKKSVSISVDPEDNENGAIPPIAVAVSVSLADPDMSEVPAASCQRSSMDSENSSMSPRSQKTTSRLMKQAREMTTNIEAEMADESLDGALQLREEWDLAEDKLRALKRIQRRMSVGSMTSMKSTVRRQYLLRSDKLKFPWYIMHPNSKQRISWDVLAVFVILFEICFSPLHLYNMEDSFRITAETLQWIATGFWILDIPMSFLTAVFVNDNVQCRLVDIAKSYLSTWFLFDLMMLVPDLIVAMSSKGDQPTGVLRLVRFRRMIRLLRFFQIIRLWRIVEGFNFVEGRLTILRTEFGSLIRPVLHVLILMTVSVHVLGSLWFAAGYVEGGWVMAEGLHERSLGRQYTRSLEWALSRLPPSALRFNVELTTAAERWLGIAGTCAALICSSIFVSFVTNTMANVARERMRTTKILQSVRKYCATHCISYSYTMQMKRYVEREHRRNELCNHMPLLQTLPEGMVRELFQEARAPTLHSHAFFKESASTDPSMELNLCSQAVTEFYLLAGDTVFDMTRKTEGMYFMASGVSIYFYWSSETPQMTRRRSSRRNTTGSRFIGLMPSMSSSPPPTRSCSKVTMAQTVLEAGEYIAEAALWVKAWRHQGQLQSMVESRALLVSTEDLFKVFQGYANVLANAVVYARCFVQEMNKTASVSGGVTDLPLGHNDEDLEPESRRSRRSYSTRSVKSTRSLRSVQPG